MSAVAAHEEKPWLTLCTHCHGHEESPAITRPRTQESPPVTHTPGSPGVTRDDSTPLTTQETPLATRETPLDIREPPIATHETALAPAAASVPRACDTLPHDADALSPSDITTLPWCDTDGIMPLRDDALGDATPPRSRDDATFEPESCDGGGITPLRSRDDAALDDDPGPASCDVGSITSLRSRDNATFEPTSCDASGVTSQCGRSDAALGNAAPRCDAAKHQTKQGGSEEAMEDTGNGEGVAAGTWEQTNTPRRDTIRMKRKLSGDRMGRPRTRPNGTA